MTFCNTNELAYYCLINYLLSMKNLILLSIFTSFLFVGIVGSCQTANTLTEKFELENTSENDTGTLMITMTTDAAEVTTLAFSIERTAADQYDAYDAEVSGPLTKVEKNIWMYSESGTFHSEGEEHEVDPCYIMIYFLKEQIEVKTFGCLERSNAGAYILSFDGVYQK